ncbi:hypothetical protein [Vallitalea guaymasensis]|uniref:Uncharacterized protein n=1 Tax=Vallitalea guaymasensis TaxID=1185412 RepID=A0A8J8SDW3_9FIRM|nr:hypothetical protein [Vallitalea guaymasensis]QUH31134.1 hypothetical protein HYG85_20300 [Vallitalea guaymasensis]
MILYLTSKIYMNILDFLKDEEEVLIKKYVGEFSLKEFLGKSIQRLGHIETIVIDRTCITDTEEQIVNAVKTFKLYSKIKIVFYMAEQNESLVHNLIELGIFNIITQTEVKALKEEIKMCLFDSMSEDYIKRKIGLLCEDVQQRELDFKEKQITIGVVGTQNRVGTTTIAMQFASYLKSIGGIVSYIETNDSGHLKLIAEYYKMQQNGDGYFYNGIAYESINSINETVFDFMIYDLGVLNSKTAKGLINCDIRIVCGGKKPHELPYFEKSVLMLKEVKKNIVINGSNNCAEDTVYVAMPCNNMLNEKSNMRIFGDITENYFRGDVKDE